MICSLNKNKSFLAPNADKLSSKQLNFLIVNSPFTVILNNYKSNLFDLDCLRLLIVKNNGFTYHPNKNVKTRAFEEFNTALSSIFLNGLVVFAFFNRYNDTLKFLSSLEDTDYSIRLSYYSLLLNGHIVSKGLLTHSTFFNNPLMALNHYHTLFCNKIIFFDVITPIQHCLSKICFIIDAYSKSTN